VEATKIYRLNSNRPSVNQPISTVGVTATAPKTKLLDQVRQAICTRHYSPKTEESYVHWIKLFSFSTTNGIRPKWVQKKSLNIFQASPVNAR
jgi:hypothetical protein